jgi:hypothetical protein
MNFKLIICIQYLMLLIVIKTRKKYHMWKGSLEKINIMWKLLSTSLCKPYIFDEWPA